MTFLTSSAANYDDALWLPLIGGALLVALGIYGLVTGSGSSPRYALAIIACGLSGFARVLAARSDHDLVQRTPSVCVGITFGLLVAGFVG